MDVKLQTYISSVNDYATKVGQYEQNVQAEVSNQNTQITALTDQVNQLKNAGTLSTEDSDALDAALSKLTDAQTALDTAAKAVTPPPAPAPTPDAPATP